MKTQLYEGMFIIHTDNDDQASRNEVLEEIKAELKRQDGTVESVVELGKKTFTYQIKKQKAGYYYLIYMNIDPQAVSKLIVRFKLNLRILRQLIIKIEEIPTIETRKFISNEEDYSPEPDELDDSDDGVFNDDEPEDDEPEDDEPDSNDEDEDEK